MLSLLNQGYYVSSGVMEVKKVKPPQHQQELYDSLMKNGKVPRSHHFECVFKNSGLSYPFSNSKTVRSQTASSIIQKGLHEFGKAQGVFAKRQSSKGVLRDEIVSKEDKKSLQRWEQTINSDYLGNNHQESEEDIQQDKLEERYNQPIMLNYFQSQRQNETDERKKGLINVLQKRSSLDMDFILNHQKIDSEEAQALSSGLRSENYELPHNVVADQIKNERINLHGKKLSLDIDFARSQKQFSPEENWIIDSTSREYLQTNFSNKVELNKMPASSQKARERTPLVDEINNFRRFNDAAALIQNKFREYLQRKSFQEEQTHQNFRSHHSNFNSFGTDRQGRKIKKLFEQSKPFIKDQSSEEEIQAPMNSQKDEIFENENDIESQQHFYEFQAREISPGSLYSPAIQKLTALKSLIEKDHPKIKNIQERINDVKYYFEFAQNLISEYTKQIPLSSETHDLILAYNETFKNAHKELDSINRELLIELENAEKFSREENFLVTENDQDYNEYDEFQRGHLPSFHCLDLIKELWGNMKDMSQSMLNLQEERKKTEFRLQQLERENEDYKNKYVQLRHRANEVEVKYDRLMRNTEKSNSKITEKETELDGQLEVEILKSHKLKQRLLEALEEYEQPSIRYSKSSSFNSGFQRDHSKKHFDSDRKSSKADIYNSLGMDFYENEELNNSPQRAKNDDWLYNQDRGDSSDNMYANTTMGSRREDSPLKFNHRIPFEESPVRIDSIREQEIYDQPLSFLNEKPALSPKFGYNLGGKEYNSSGKSWPSVDQMKKNLLMSLKKSNKLQFDAKDIFKKKQSSFSGKLY